MRSYDVIYGFSQREDPFWRLRRSSVTALIFVDYYRLSNCHASRLHIYSLGMIFNPLMHSLKVRYLTILVFNTILFRRWDFDTITLKIRSCLPTMHFACCPRMRSEMTGRPVFRRSSVRKWTELGKIKPSTSHILRSHVY